MKKLLKLLIFGYYIFIISSSIHSQDTSTLTLGLGTNSYGSDVNNSEFVNSDIGVNLGFFTPLLKKERFNFGLNLAADYRAASNDFGNLSGIIPIHSREGLTTTSFTNDVGQSLLNFGVGPQFNFKLSNKFWLSPILQVGYFNFNQDEVQVTQENVLGENTFSTEIFTQDEVKENGLFFNSALRLNYQINKQWGVWAGGNYFLADVNITQSTLIPIGEPDDNGEYDVFQVIEAAAGETDFEVTERKTSLNNFGVNFGIAYSLGGGGKIAVYNEEKGQDYNSSRSNKVPTKSSGSDANKDNTEKDDNNKKAQDYNSSRSNKQKTEANHTGDETDDLVDVKTTKAQDYNSSRSNKPSSVAFTNPLEERKEKKKPQHQLIGVLPVNNSSFEEVNEIKNFTWELIGNKIPNPQFIIEVNKVNSNQQPLRSYSAKTSKTSISAKEVFKGTELADGQYRWKVIETNTGTTSNAMFFSLSSCVIDFSITNEEIECLGYEGDKVKYRICFDSNYSSSSGDLEYTDPNSGLFVYGDGNLLAHTLVSPNTSLVSQPGNSANTVSYCFEVTVPSTVAAIEFGLQGDDLNTNPNFNCQPAANVFMDELPDCICDDCEDIQLSFDDYTISMNGNTGNEFDINGNLNVSVPIYGVEVQVQSFSYSANPSACTDGVSSVEESGMILMPGTTINGSTSLQLANESISGSPNTNNNATKNIKYTSLTALTGAIPVNLRLGLPGPLPGLDPDCCKIEYTVCIKIRVIYDEDECKSCVFTHCFTFVNQ